MSSLYCTNKLSMDMCVCMHACVCGSGVHISLYADDAVLFNSDSDYLRLKNTARNPTFYSFTVEST